MEKTHYEKACDEAVYLSFAVQNAIIALGQGLFQIHVTQAPICVSKKDSFALEAYPFDSTAYQEKSPALSRHRSRNAQRVYSGTPE